MKKEKKYNNNKKINGILNSTFDNMIPSLQSGVNLIFINSKFGNLIPGQSIQEENSDSSSSDEEDSIPKKKKIRGNSKKKKRKNSRNKPQKYYGKPKNPIQKNQLSILK